MNALISVGSPSSDARGGGGGDSTGAGLAIREREGKEAVRERSAAFQLIAKAGTYVARCVAVHGPSLRDSSGRDEWQEGDPRGVASPSLPPALTSLSTPAHSTKCKPRTPPRPNGNLLHQPFPHPRNDNASTLLRRAAPLPAPSPPSRPRTLLLPLPMFSSASLDYPTATAPARSPLRAWMQRTLMRTGTRTRTTRSWRDSKRGRDWRGTL